MLSIMARTSSLSNGISTVTNFNSHDFALVAIVGYRYLHFHLPDGVNVLVGFGLQDDLFHAAKERRDFVKHCPEKVRVWRHPPNSFDEVVVPIPKVELDATIRLGESRIETAEMGDRQMKTQNSLHVGRLGAQSKREFRVVCLADGTESILRTRTASGERIYLQIHTDNDEYIQILHYNYRYYIYQYIHIIPTYTYRYTVIYTDNITYLLMLTYTDTY
jgi:hypothetical protein